MAHMEIWKPKTLNISLKDKVLLNLLCLASYISDFTPKIMV